MVVTDSPLVPLLAVPARAVLRPSTHARGVRPYTYRGEIDAYHAPGVEAQRQQTKCAVDAAWIVEGVLGRPTVSPTWPGVPGARERAVELAKKTGLYDYQQEGSAFLAERDYALLTDDMGIGKTAQSLIAAEARLSLAIVPNTMTPVVLVLCPALAKNQWRREILKWTGHESSILDGLRPYPLPSTRYIIANYDIMYGSRRRDAAGVMHASDDLVGWGTTLTGQFLITILDEAHTLRGRNSRRTTALKSALRKTPVVWGLTGTPMPNYVRDLWSLLDFVSDGLQGPYWTWARTYADAHQAQYGMVDTGSSNLDQLRQRLTFYCLGRTKQSVALQLPEKRREVFKVDVEVSAATVHEGHSVLTKSGFVAKALRRTAAAKRSAVVATVVEALQAKQKVVVFSYMREQCDALAKAIKAAVDCPVMCVHGDMSPEGRDAQATVFRDAQAPCAFVATIDSVGIAISLVGADLVVFGDLVPEPHKLLQAEARAHRHGSTNRVLIRYMIATGTLDEDVAERVIDKLDTIGETLGVATDQQDMHATLGGRSDESIIDGLFERLKALSGGSDE